MTDLATTTTLPVPRPPVGFSLDTINSRCPVCGRTFEDCTCTSVITGLTAQTFDDGSDACPICGNWICTCDIQRGSYAITDTAHDPLHRPDVTGTPAPPLDIAISQARQALTQCAAANIHDGMAMMLAATSLDYVLRDVLAAIDAEAGR